MGASINCENGGLPCSLFLEPQTPSLVENNISSFVSSVFILVAFQLDDIFGSIEFKLFINLYYNVCSSTFLSTCTMNQCSDVFLCNLFVMFLILECELQIYLTFTC